MGIDLWGIRDLWECTKGSNSRKRDPEEWFLTSYVWWFALYVVKLFRGSLVIAISCFFKNECVDCSSVLHVNEMERHRLFLVCLRIYRGQRKSTRSIQVGRNPRSMQSVLRRGCIANSWCCLRDTRTIVNYSSKSNIRDTHVFASRFSINRLTMYFIDRSLFRISMARISQINLLRYIFRLSTFTTLLLYFPKYILPPCRLNYTGMAAIKTCWIQFTSDLPV